MTETTEQAEQRQLKELEGKNIAHYSILLNAWINIEMKRDKILVTLSVAAIGLLVTILTTVGVENTWGNTILYNRGIFIFNNNM